MSNGVEKQGPSFGAVQKGEFRRALLLMGKLVELTNVSMLIRSGGVERTWEGFPYQFTEDEGKTFRCACIKSTDGKDPKLKPYENCSEDRSTCYVKSN